MAAGTGTASPVSGPGVVRDLEASQSKKRPGREGGEGARRSDAMAGGGGSSDGSGRAAGRRASRSGGRARRGRQEPGLGGATERGAGEARLEEAVNRWVLKFYFHEALRAFRGSRYGDFRQIRDIMQGEGRTWGRRLAGGGALWGSGSALGSPSQRCLLPSFARQALGEGAHRVPAAAGYAVSVAHRRRREFRYGDFFCSSRAFFRVTLLFSNLRPELTDSGLRCTSYVPITVVFFSV